MELVNFLGVLVKVDDDDDECEDEEFARLEMNVWFEVRWIVKVMVIEFEDWWFCGEIVVV
jgi:hypothetical protein